ncbi:unnamed protein product [Spirodela intermedia]|uniref:CRC domain-containing protein n=1 Tax=Spirodela intermedia TaxID=51605 RepID=A0A7I8INH5_SPIIN|nr:unnamed protein product [Spirodela intermedia]CAA6658526.1 unnamed protein product [Spirodela intermedia]
MSTVNPSHPVNYDCAGPNHNGVPSFGVIVDHKSVRGNIALDQFGCNHQEEGQPSLTEIKISELPSQEQSREKLTGRNWDLIMDDNENFLIFDSSTESEACKEHNQIMRNHVESYSALSSSNLSKSNNDDSQKMRPDDFLCVCSSPHDPTVHLPKDDSQEVGEKAHAELTPQAPLTCCEKPVNSGLSDKMCVETSGCVSLSVQVGEPSHRGIRRRCLVFEMGGSHEQNMLCDPENNTPPSLSPSVKLSPGDRQQAFFKPCPSPQSTVVPSIGLHLNSLAIISKEGTSAEDAFSCERQSGATVQKHPSISLKIERDDLSCGSEIQDLASMQDSFQVPATGCGDNLNPGSPMKEIDKTENGGETGGCKRCKCKKSKCLKLYCECFAAGLYCVGLCECQDCLNKPMYEDTVLAARKLIESRNPLAFAPKVIRTSEPATEICEDTNKTPASARHKRGCNCKKSRCLKKYCECYQGGVGCSPSCRCEGCMNTFGKRDDPLPFGNHGIVPEEEEIHATDKDAPQHDFGRGYKDGKPFSESVLPTTPASQIRSSFGRPPFFSTVKPPRASSIPKPTLDEHLQMDSEDEMPDILSYSLLPASAKNTTSPNRKRISPPHHGVNLSPSRKGGRKLILRSIPSLPPLTSDSVEELGPSVMEL